MSDYLAVERVVARYNGHITGFLGQMPRIFEPNIKVRVITRFLERVAKTVALYAQNLMEMKEEVPPLGDVLDDMAHLCEEIVRRAGRGNIGFNELGYIQSVLQDLERAGFRLIESIEQRRAA